MPSSISSMTRGAVIPKNLHSLDGVTCRRGRLILFLTCRQENRRQKNQVRKQHAGAYAPPCSDGDDTTTTRPERRSYYGFYLCAEHVQQLGGASPLRNLMEVKG